LPNFQSSKVGDFLTVPESSKIQKFKKEYRDSAHTNCDAKRTSKSAGSPGARLSAFGPAGGENFEDI
jgi:hypothetical protein